MTNQPYRFPVSIKGVVVREGRVVLLRNERHEWELPGGKLDLGEEPTECLRREIKEEIGWQVTTGPLLDVWQYHIGAGVDVLVITYGCHVGAAADPVASREHDAVGLFSESETAALSMPNGYKNSIATWYAWLRTRAT